MNSSVCDSGKIAGLLALTDRIFSRTILIRVHAKTFSSQAHIRGEGYEGKLQDSFWIWPSAAFNVSRGLCIVSCLSPWAGKNRHCHSWKRSPGREDPLRHAFCRESCIPPRRSEIL